MTGSLSRGLKSGQAWRQRLARWARVTRSMWRGAALGSDMPAWAPAAGDSSPDTPVKRCRERSVKQYTRWQIKCRGWSFERSSQPLIILLRQWRSCSLLSPHYIMIISVSSSLLLYDQPRLFDPFSYLICRRIIMIYRHILQLTLDVLRIQRFHSLV